MPSHNHSISISGSTSSAGAHTHTFMLPRGDQWWENNGGNTLWGSSWGWRRTTSSAGAHTHTVNVNGTSSNSGSGTAFSVKNPYYALIYCVKCR